MKLHSKVVAIIQARVGSTRLPGKVMMDLAGEPMLVRVVNRVRRATKLDEVVVATTTNSDDDRIVALGREHGWPVFRGSVEDVLDRYYQAALAHRAEAVVRITSDCPFIDAEVIGKVVQEFLSLCPDIDYVSNSMQRTFPRGLDVELMSMHALKKAWQEDENPCWREHVTPYIWRNPEKFRTGNVASPVDYSYMRWTVDTEQDLAFARKIYDRFQKDTFSWREVLTLLDRHPEWLEINRNIVQKVIS